MYDFNFSSTSSELSVGVIATTLDRVDFQEKMEDDLLVRGLRFSSDSDEGDQCEKGESSSIGEENEVDFRREAVMDLIERRRSCFGGRGGGRGSGEVREEGES